MSRIHAVFYPGETPWPQSSPELPALHNAGSRPRAAVNGLVRGVCEFYRDPSAWQALLITSVLLCYVGGALMFWFHAVALAEGGPAISWYAHWLLDSTFGFLALTPALFLIIPFAAWGAQRLAAPNDARLSWLYVAIAGGVFALVTVPGPLAHDLVVGRGTWIATRVTALVGDPAATLAPVPEYPLVATLSQQLGAAVPTYLVGVAVALLAVRGLARQRRRAAAIEARAVALGAWGRALRAAPPAGPAEPVDRR
jgi:hypothetical protein